MTISYKRIMKGIILAGGFGTRLYPMTVGVSKHLLPVYDKPMIYYSISVLMQLNIVDILIITTCRDIEMYQSLFGDGQGLGLNISYKIQYEPRGIAEAFIIGREFIGKDAVTLILGDNFFHGNDLHELSKNIYIEKDGAINFASYVENPSDYGVVKFSSEGQVISIIEKPTSFISNYAVTGLYIYGNEVIYIAQSLKPSKRGELEITDINNYYLNSGKLEMIQLDSGIKWFDLGNPDSLLSASIYVKEQQLLMNQIACIEEIALCKGYISRSQLSKRLSTLPNASYKTYIKKVTGLTDET